MRKFIKFKSDPFRPIDFEKNPRWKREGGSYVLKSVDLEEDRQFLYAGMKMSADKEYKDDKRLYIEGMANANVVDRMDERVDPRGLDTTDFLKNMQFLAHHSYYDPIGQVEALDIQEDGVHFRAWIGDPSKGPLTDMQREIRSLVAQGILKTVSIGFIPKKIRPGAYDDNGKIVDPWVIEEWELLEISVVSIPANQDSVFEMKKLTSESKSATVKKEVSLMKLFNKNMIKLLSEKGVQEILEEMAKARASVQRLIFSASKFDKDAAVAWAKEYEFKSEVLETKDDVIEMLQREASDFQEDSLQELELDEGVKAVVGKAKENEEPQDDGTEVDDDGSSDNVEATYRKESMLLLKNINEATKRVAEMCKTLVEKSDEKPCPGGDDDEDDDEDKDKSKTPDSSEGASDGEPSEHEKTSDEVLERIKRLEKTVDSLANSVKILAEITA